jgi:hypothetical protein
VLLVSHLIAVLPENPARLIPSEGKTAFQPSTQRLWHNSKLRLVEVFSFYEVFSAFAVTHLPITVNSVCVPSGTKQRTEGSELRQSAKFLLGTGELGG